MKIQITLLLLLLTFGCLAAESSSDDDGPIAVYQTDLSFEEAIENIQMAVEARGLRVSGILHVSDMLNRTAADLGFTQVYKKAESVEFCSALISHKMTQVAPENLSICPFTIAVFIKTAEPQQVYLAYRHPKLAGSSDKITQEVEEFLSGIVQESIE